MATLSTISLAGIVPGNYSNYLAAAFAGDVSYNPSSAAGNLTITRRR